MIRLPAAAIATFLALGCGGPPSPGDGAGGAPPSCDVKAPSSCPSPEPTYANDVAPVIASKCTPCHAPGGVEAQRSLVDWNGVFSQRNEVLQQVASCRMPQDGRAMSDAERETLLAWIVCGAKND